jgi:streptomycin 3"-adenylyltransferase
VELDEGLSRYLEQLTQAVRDVLRDGLIGVYAHGSIALGGYRPDRSDVDVLVVVGRPLTDEQASLLGRRLGESELPCPAQGLELSVVTTEALSDATDRPRFELHVGTAEHVVVRDSGRGDPDLVMHMAVCRGLGLALAGPPAAVLLPEVPRPRLLAALDGEMDWGERHGSPTYCVLNACRAMRFAQEGVLCSKLDGGRWALARSDDEASRQTIRDALAFQEGSTDSHPEPAAARNLLRDARRTLRDALSAT